MNRFPLCIDLNGKPVYLIGEGEQIRQTAEKMTTFCADLICRDAFTEADAENAPAMVIVGDTPRAEAERIFKLCCEYRIPVNVVDVPELCSFYFPALITRGNLTISVSTAGSSPMAAAHLRQKIEDMLPDNTEQILCWLSEHRSELNEKRLLKAATVAAFSLGRPLTDDEAGKLTVNFL